MPASFERSIAGAGAGAGANGGRSADSGRSRGFPTKHVTTGRLSRRKGFWTCRVTAVRVWRGHGNEPTSVAGGLGRAG